jgi:hypothetical protein
VKFHPFFFFADAGFRWYIERAANGVPQIVGKVLSAIALCS